MFAPDRPAFWWHSLKADAWGRAGTLIDDSFKITDDGLYAEALIHEGDLGDKVLRAVEAGDAAWSSGTLPHLMKVRSSGFVERWPLVEGSIAPKDAVVSQPRATTVYHVRAVLPGNENLSSDMLEDTSALKRSVWLMEPTEKAGQTPPATDGAEDLRAEVKALTDAVGSLTQQFINAPTRSLPPGGADMFGNPQPRISVTSKYDGLSLMAMVCLDQARAMQAHKKNRLYVRDEDFMRATLDKMRVIHDAEAKTEVLPDENGLRAVDDLAYETWHKKVPHLRASEAMQSTLAGSGDELVPTLFNSAAHYSFRVESRIYGLLDTFTLPSNPYTWPTISGGPTIRRVSEATDQSQANIAASNRPASKPTTAAVTFTCLQEGIGALALVSSVLFDDAGIDVAEVLATQFTRNMADAIDYVLLNGDESATTTNLGNYGTDPTGTAYDKILILNGLRYIANANSDTADVGSLGIDDLTTIQLLMGTRGVIGTDLANLFLAVDPGVYYKLKTLSEFRTRDKVGESMMTLAQGFVGMWDAIPVILSDQMEWMTVDTLRIPAAHNIATGGDSGGMVLIHKHLNKVGVMREITMEAGPVPHTGLFAMSGTVRLDLQSMEAGSVAHGYGITI
jgi:hypothetical protein